MVLRDPSLNGISREHLFKESDRRVAIDENVFFNDALIHARQADENAAKRLLLCPSLVNFIVPLS